MRPDETEYSRDGHYQNGEEECMSPVSSPIFLTLQYSFSEPRGLAR